MTAGRRPPGLPARVTVVEVGPRDGLQNEPARLSAEEKAGLVDRLSAAGLPVIEVAAFVSPKWVPQMADAAGVAARMTRRAGTRYLALVPNAAGLERAREAGLREVAVFAAASDAFSLRNTNQPVAAVLEIYRDVCARAREGGVRVRAYVSTAFGCPFEGEVPASRVAAIARALVDMGAYEVAVSDTIGIAHPGQVHAVVGEVAPQIGLDRLALHLHDTRGTALANVLEALRLGVTTFDASCGGLGGCPYAPGAAGNLATEDLVYMLDGLGIETGISLDGVVAASRYVEALVGHPLPSRYYRAAAARADGSSASATADH